MSLSKLYVFSKNTDAHASQRGYNYQTLCTLEVWVKNLLQDIDEEIFCEYEEDIFQRNLENEKAKFKQIKLYSSNFSFKSDEVKKCIVHFFMLHVKLDYESFDKQYIFETNTGVAKEYSGNDASLLMEWFESQDSPSEEQLNRFSNKVNEIVTEYINEEYGKDKKTHKPNIEEAFSVFQTLDENFWLEFSKCIKWIFLKTDPSNEFATVKERIQKDLYELPYNINSDNITSFFGVLLEYVFQRTSQDNHEDRKLTSQKLASLILSEKDEDDKWYTRRFDYYKNIESIDEFRIGEFYEIIDLVNYCRRKKYLLRDKEKWNSLLSYYINDPKIDSFFRRKIIYELVFLNYQLHEIDFSNLSSYDLPEGSLAGFEKEIRYYFSDFEQFNDAEELEKAQIILNIIFPLIVSKKINISNRESINWNFILFKRLNKKISECEDPNVKCNLLEQNAHFHLFWKMLKLKKKLDFIKHYYKIIENINEAKTYNIAQLGDRVNKKIKLFITIDPTDKSGVIKLLEKFSEKISPYIQQRNGKITLAKQQVERGVQYLKQTDRFYLLKAIECFHQAKDNYYHENTKEGFVLGLLNIGQFYNSIGMNYAAKYYALGAFRISTNESMIKRVEDSLTLLFYSDFKQGNWFDAISIFRKFIIVRDSSNQTESDRDKEVFKDLSMINHFMTNLSNQYKYLIDAFILSLGYIGSEIIVPLTQTIEDQIKSDDDFCRVIETRIDDHPLNDIGDKRAISFYALGSLWKIVFNNDYSTTSVAEEFISMIQITLVEIALTEIDFHLIKGVVEIELVISDKIQNPIQIHSNDEMKWQVFLNFFDNADKEKIKHHTVCNSVSLLWVLNAMSLLKKAEFDDLYWKFIRERSLDTKHIAVNLFQRIYRDVYDKNDFESSKKQLFVEEDFGLNLPKENTAMKWFDSLSGKYNQEKAIEYIRNRFDNANKSIYLTLDHLKQDPEYPDFINSLRLDGWNDWQIILSIYNFVINYKVSKLAKEEELGSKESYYSVFEKYKKMDEKDCYVHFPLKAFKSERFYSQFNINLISFLSTFGLENKFETPNFIAIKEFLDVRFNLLEDDYQENNPLRDIKPSV